MIRPIFNVTQDDSFIYIEAKVKYVKISDFEYFIEDNNFRFTLKPYYLNINLPKKLNSESNLNNFTYEPENQRLICKIQKLNIGENFENLEFISTLYNTKSNNDKALSNNKSIFSKIQEINENNEETTSNNENNINLTISINNEKDLNDYLFNKYTEEKNKIKSNKNTLENLENIKTIKNISEYKYGFNNSFFDVFDKRKEELLEICDLNPKEVPINKRYLFKLEKENNDFNSEHYITDLFLDDEKSDFYDEFFSKIISENLDKKDKKFLESIKDKKNKDNFDEIENEVLYKISKLNIKESENDNNLLKYKFSIYLNVIDILFSFLYNGIVTEYENNSESGWNIDKLSATLSCLMDFDLNYYSQSNEISFDILNEALENLIISNYRRILIYPLYRNIKLCEKIKFLLIKVLDIGRFGILKCLLKIKNIFDRNEPRFLLNVIYIDPLIKWIQEDADEKIFEIIKNVINKIKIKKEQLKLDLDTFENEYLNNINDDIEMEEENN